MKVCREKLFCWEIILQWSDSLQLGNERVRCFSTLKMRYSIGRSYISIYMNVQTTKFSKMSKNDIYERPVLPERKINCFRLFGAPLGAPENFKSFGRLLRRFPLFLERFVPPKWCIFPSRKGAYVKKDCIYPIYMNVQIAKISKNPKTIYMTVRYIWTSDTVLYILLNIRTLLNHHSICVNRLELNPNITIHLLLALHLGPENRSRRSRPKNLMPSPSLMWSRLQMTLYRFCSIGM